MIILSILIAPPRARAQVTASATATTNYLYRGISLSDGHPALALVLAYDDQSGFYAGGSLIGDTSRRSGAQLLGYQEYLGYAARLSPVANLDIGVSDLDYRSYYYGHPEGRERNTETYAGISWGSWNYYIHYSPDYFHPGARALYGEVNGAVPLPRPLRLIGHVGVLTPLGGGGDGKERYDIRLGIAAALRHGEAQLAWSTARPAPSYLDAASDGHGVLALSLTWVF